MQEMTFQGLNINFQWSISPGFLAPLALVCPSYFHYFVYSDYATGGSACSPEIFKQETHGRTYTTNCSDLQEVVSLAAALCGEERHTKCGCEGDYTRG